MAPDANPSKVFSQTSGQDQTSLLQLQELAAVASHDAYTYVEVGSLVGGSLAPHLADDRCVAAVSIDPRPPFSPDIRGEAYRNECSTSHMIDTLRAELGDRPLAKLRTFDLSAQDAVAAGVVPSFDLALIDAEHTFVAVISDFLALLPVAKQNSLLVFHDADILASAMLSAERILDYLGTPYASAFLPERIFAIGLGSVRGPLEKLQALDRPAFIERSTADLNKQIYRSERRRRRRDMLRRIGLVKNQTP